MDTSEQAPPNGFVELGAELKRRFVVPVRHVTFWTYLVVGVIFFGGLAVWVEGVRLFTGTEASPDHLKIALNTFFPALVGSVSTQLVFEEAGRNKRMLAFALSSVFFRRGVTPTNDGYAEHSCCSGRWTDRSESRQERS